MARLFAKDYHNKSTAGISIRQLLFWKKMIYGFGKPVMRGKLSNSLFSGSQKRDILLNM
jgi:hypothetical protein